MTDADLIRFVNAQTDAYGKVIEELTDGCKRTHWMWFIFPQLAGLGHSPLAQRYARRFVCCVLTPCLEAVCVMTWG